MTRPGYITMAMGTIVQNKTRIGKRVSAPVAVGIHVQLRLTGSGRYLILITIEDRARHHYKAISHHHQQIRNEPIDIITRKILNRNMNHLSRLEQRNCQRLLVIVKQTPTNTYLQKN